MENLEISKEDIRSGERKWRPQCKTQTLKAQKLEVEVEKQRL